MTLGGLSDSNIGRTVLRGLVGAAIVHICVTFATPYLFGQGAYRQLADHLPSNTLVSLGPPTPRSQVLNYQEPDMHLAVCSYDASSVPVLAKAVLPGSGWTLALYSPAGDNFYILPGQDQKPIEINVVLTTGGDDTSALPTKPGSQGSLTLVHLPAARGLLVIRGPIKGESYRADVEAVMARASCAPARARGAAG